MSKPNLLIIGAAGNIGRAFLTLLPHVLDRIGELVLMDGQVPKDADFPKLMHHGCLYVCWIGPKTLKEVDRVIKSHQIDIVIDLTDIDTPLLATHLMKQPVSYLNTAYCQASEGNPLEALRAWLHKLPNKTKRPHILFSGMNPGVINILAAEGIKEFGKPLAITEFEYDSSHDPRHPERHLVTWSLNQFLAEMVDEPAEATDKHGQILREKDGSFYHCEAMKELLSPFVRLKLYPYGCLSAHEECFTLSERFGVPCKFIYSIHPRTMDYLRRLIKRGIHDFSFAQSLSTPMTGTDMIGLALDYPKQRVTYFTRLSNKDVKGMNATAYQVVVGVLAGLTVLLDDTLDSRAYFVEDLLKTSYLKTVKQFLPIERKVMRLKAS